MTLSVLAPSTSPESVPGIGCCSGGIIELLADERETSKPRGGGGNLGTGGRLLLKKPCNGVPPCWGSSS